MHSLGATVSEDLAATSTDAAADTSPTRQTSHPSCAKANASRSESIPTCMQSDVTSTDYPMVHQTTLASTLALCATTLEMWKSSSKDSSISTLSIVKVRARFISTLPSAFEDFSRLVCRRCEQQLAPSLSRCGSCDNSQTGWEWMFALLLDDSTERIWITVAGEEATKFLGLKPCDLRRNETRLDELKGTLTPLFEHDHDSANGTGEGDVCIKLFVPETFTNPDTRKPFDAASVSLCLFATQLV
eukprot:m.309114 g.309114  ORF g.309114 m.309114 type:complete len:244 (-) comp15945_c0_seq1:1964-2695(-)